MYSINSDFPNQPHLDDLLYNPFEFEHNDEHDQLLDVDPDLNFYNVHSNISLKVSDYFTTFSYKKYIDSYDVSEDNLSFFHHNIRSMNQNLSSLTTFVSTLPYAFSCIGLSETWLNVHTASFINIPGYSHVFKYRTDRVGGGVSLLLKDNIPYTVREDLSAFNEHFETVFVEIDKHVFSTNANVVVGVIYRIPGTDINIFNDYLDEKMNLIKTEKKLSYYMGDFNINLLHADNHTPTNDFVETIFSHSVIPLITRPTRISNTSSTLIDNILTNNFMESDCLKGIFVSDITDHFPIFCIDVKYSLSTNDSPIYRRMYTSDNFVKFRENLPSEKLDNILKSSDAQLAMTNFHELLCSAHNAAFPLRKVKLGYTNKKPWLTESLKKAIHKKNSLYIDLRNDYSDEKSTKYKQYKSTLSRLLRKSEKDHYLSLLTKHKHNSRKMWDTLKSVINSKKSSIKQTLFHHNDCTVSDPKEIVDKFNNFFVHIGPTLADKIDSVPTPPESYLAGSFNNSMFLIPTTEFEISKIVMNLKESSPGYDQISSKVLKSSLDLILPHLVHIVNLSFVNGVFPKELKIANIIPLFKSGNMSLFTNYRPISLLNTLSKVFEKVFYKRLYSFLEQFKILYMYQFGFRELHNTNMALLILMDKLMTALDNDEYAIGIFLDFSKAFDTVDHDILLRKLNFYGIRGTPHEWIRSYLSEREQFTSYNGYTSSNLRISCGVPQGSILGPLLFLIYVNDLAFVSPDLFTIMFADDTNCFITGKDLEGLAYTLNSELSKIVIWLNANKLSLNVAKTHYMIFQPKKRHLDIDVPIYINRSKISKVEYCKFLGVLIDDKLSWSNHIAHVKLKLSKVVGIMYRSRKNLNHEHLCILYKSLFEPYISYCNIIWSSATKTNLDPLIKLQKRAIRCICFLKRNASTTLH